MDAAHLAIDELQPQVDLAGYWEFDHDVWHRYGLPGHHLILVRRGRIEAITAQGRLTAGPGSLVCFRPCALNQYGNRGLTASFQLHLAFAPAPRHLLTPWLDGVGALPVLTDLSAHRAAAEGHCEAAVAALAGASSADRLRLRAAILGLLALVAEAAGERCQRRAPLDRWQEARRRLQSRLDAELPLAEVARMMGVGVDHFTRAFRARFGVSPGRCRTQARLRLAAQLLRAGASPVKAVARRVGVRDATAFTRLFRRHFGVPPSSLVQDGAPEPTWAAEPQATIPVNQHVLPPGTAGDWQRRFRPWRP